ncbi:putative RNA-directed DNA polymerase from transposon X-element [Stylophora pistillata]|uniref:Putative RNA-directed DNA polymerase from transposon X-element n=1 Tax=Stylophora pistillata TaxID=50429 RepID=A0A2B4S174_STYPI|nr:putative RNA-directed DNA polymerase from transposon X-element [Stylophora pistillata]
MIKDDSSLVENYRLISILSSIPKILEKVMYDQLYDAFKTHFSLNMYGFLSGHSCCTALPKMVDDWRLALESKKVTGTIAIDLSKAFDSVCHSLLLAKLRVYGLNDDALRFVQSYLTERQQRVIFNCKFSDWLPVQCGVPQDLTAVPFHIASIFDDVDDHAWAFGKLFLDIANEHAPIKQFHIRGGQVPYMTPEWRRAIRQT